MSEHFTQPEWPWGCMHLFCFCGFLLAFILVEICYHVLCWSASSLASFYVIYIFFGQTFWSICKIQEQTWYARALVSLVLPCINHDWLKWLQVPFFFYFFVGSYIIYKSFCSCFYLFITSIIEITLVGLVMCVEDQLLHKQQ